MARPLRIEYPGAFYHVINRGLSRRNIFMEDKGRLCIPLNPATRSGAFRPVFR
jgi:hypothetical protein